MSEKQNTSTDTLLRFWLPHACARLAAISFREVIDQANPHTVYPPIIVQALNEMAMAATLMMANLPPNPKATVCLYIRHESASVSLLVAECDGHYNVRTTAHIADDFVVPPEASLQSLVNPDGQGQFVVQILVENTHQGVVPMQGETIAEMLQNHMSQSDQLDSRWLMASNTEYSQALFLQRIPVDGGTQDTPSQEEADEAWETLLHKINTMGADEMLGIDQQTLLQRLFWEDQLMPIDVQHVQWRCRCSRPRFLNSLLSLGESQVMGFFEEDQEATIEMGCQFCGAMQRFGRDEVAEAFEKGAEEVLQEPRSTTPKARPS